MVNILDLSVGDLVDVESVDILYPAVIESVHYINSSESSKHRISSSSSSSTISHIKVHYIGWESSYDEKLSVEDFSTRVFPGGMYVKKYKVWANLSPSFPVWPCYLYLRPAKDENKGAINFLKKEKLMLIIPYGADQSCMKDFRNGKLNAYTH